MRSAIVGTMMIVLLAMSCAYCASQPQVAIAPTIVDPIANPRLGGPGFRVFDTDEIDAVDALPALVTIYQSAERCAGTERDFHAIRVFAVSKIEKRWQSGWSDTPNGLQFRNSTYIKAGLESAHTAWVLEHEFMHYVTRKGHPAIDDLLKACGLYSYNRAANE